MAAHSSVLAWRIPGMGEPGGLPSMGSHRVGHDWSDLAVSRLAVAVCIYGRRQWHPTPVLLPGKSQGRGSLWAALDGVAQSRTRLKRLSSSSSSVYIYPRWLSSKKSVCNAGDATDSGSIPGLGRSPGAGNGNPLQDSCLENSMDRGAWWLQSVGMQSRTRLSD